MDKLEMRVDDLPAMAAQWQSQVAQLTTAPTLGLSCQPSAAAVDVGHTAIEVAAPSLMGQMEDGAAKVAADDAGYNAREAHSAAELAAVANWVTGL